MVQVYAEVKLDRFYFGQTGISKFLFFEEDIAKIIEVEIASVNPMKINEISLHFFNLWFKTKFLSYYTVIDGNSS